MRIIKDWKVTFAISLILLVALFFISQLWVALKVPTKGWSRDILINEISKKDASDPGRVRLTTVPITADNKFITIWNEDSSVKYVYVDGNGNASQVKKMNISVNEPRKIGALINGRVIDLYSLEEDVLKMYKFDYISGNVISGKPILSKVKDFQIVNNEVLIGGENYVKLIDSNESIKEVDKQGAQNIDMVLNNDGSYDIALLRLDNIGSLHIKYINFNPQKNITKSYEIGYIVGSDQNPQSIDNIILGKSTKDEYIMVPLRNVKVNNTTTICYRFPVKNPKNSEMFNLDDINGYNPNPVRLETNDGSFNFLASIGSIKGNKTEVINIEQFKLDGDKLIPIRVLTKTDELSINPHMFKLGTDDYLQWEDSLADSRRILLASTNKDIVEKGSRPKQGEVSNVFFDSVMAMAFGLSYMLLVFSVIMLPTLVFCIIIAVTAMNWTEANPKKVTAIAIGIHILAELYLTSHSIMKKPLVIALMPGFMQNSIVLYGIVLITAGISYLCMRLKYNKNGIDRSFVNQYAFFAVLNMIQYSLIFFPYYYL